MEEKEYEEGSMQGLTPPERSTSPPRRRRACIPCTNAKARCNFNDAETSADTAICERYACQGGLLSGSFHECDATADDSFSVGARGSGFDALPKLQRACASPDSSNHSTSTHSPIANMGRDCATHAALQPCRIVGGAPGRLDYRD